ncbi:MAG: hypothetical protein JEZ10_07565 [Verrucomicrobia bacterium]|nr:hypothetical protein [Verrucomicrobiota bacterium]
MTHRKLVSLVKCNAPTQAKISIALMAVIPALSIFYIGTVVGAGDNQVSALRLLLIAGLTVAVAIPGFIVLRKYPDNILKLRRYITEIAQGSLPDKIILADKESSDDIAYIEKSFNSVLDEMRRQIETAQEQLRIEHSLRETVEQQQQTLIEAEKHRAMIQTLGATCHHIGQPATVLQIRLEFLQKLATNQEEIREIAECIHAVQTISDLLHQLQRVSKFRTVPYAHAGDVPGDEILSISPAS